MSSPAALRQEPLAILQARRRHLEALRRLGSHPSRQTIADALRTAAEVKSLDGRLGGRAAPGPLIGPAAAVDPTARAELTNLLERVRVLLELDGLALLLPTADGTLAGPRAPAEPEGARPARRGARPRSSLLGIPLLSDDVVIGVLQTEVRYPRRFTWRIVRLLEMAAECLTLVVRQSQRGDESESIAEELGLPSDDEAILARAAALMVPDLADGGVVALRRADGALGEAAIVHVDAVAAALLRGAAPASLDWLTGVVETGRSLLRSEISDRDLAAATRHAAGRASLRALRLTSCMAVPLVVGDRIAGAVLLVSGSGRRRLGVEDLAAAEAVARRVARAAEKARRFRDVQQALRDQNELLLSSAHDLKNLVTPVQVRVDTLRAEATRVGSPERENLAQGLARIELALRRLDRLADDFIDVAGAQGGQSNDLHPSPVDLVVAASEAAAEWQQTTSRHRLRLSASTPTLVGWWDPSRLARLLDNLVQNAIKYSPEGGDIDVEVERLLERGREWALLRVRDHGLGIPLEEQRHVFAPFRRGANVAMIKGSGIGLTAVRQIVEQHRGSVAVDSTPGLGSTFTVRLPISGAEPSPTPGRFGHLVPAESEA
ncbi:MAG TPA: HAMP domain-containing sensor histidine kinase [Chloroflexota bacterium]